MKFCLKKVGDEVHLETGLEPTAYAISELANKNLGEGIGNLLEEEAEVVVGVPVSRFLFSEEKCDFHFAFLSCSFILDKYRRLVWERFGVKLFQNRMHKE